MIRLFGRERVLGKAKGRRYDIPLSKGTESGFMVLLIALMTFLAVMAVAAAFTLSAMTMRWSSGLENKATLEIPAQDKNGQALSRADVQELTAEVAAAMRNYPAISEIHVLSDEEIGALVEPWLGEDFDRQAVPLPGLISLTLKDNAGATISNLQSRAASIAPGARLDTHQEWLNDLLRFTGTLRFAALLLTLVIGLTTATAVAGAVRARMAVHADQVQLLHLMGASDGYIASQFQRHSLILALQGAAIGLLLGTVTIGIIGWLFARGDAGLLPSFVLGPVQIAGLLVMPLAAAGIAFLAAARTVHNVLADLP